MADCICYLATCVALVNVDYIVYAFNISKSGLKEYTSGTQVIGKGKLSPDFSLMAMVIRSGWYICKRRQLLFTR